MKTPDPQSTFADLLAEEAAEDERVNILEKRLLIPLGVIVVVVVAWLAWKHTVPWWGPRIPQAPHGVVRSL